MEVMRSHRAPAATNRANFPAKKATTETQRIQRGTESSGPLGGCEKITSCRLPGLLWRPLPSAVAAARERRRLDGGGVTAEAAVTTKKRRFFHSPSVSSVSSVVRFLRWRKLVLAFGFR